MSEVVLTEDQVYDAADVPQKSIPFESIKFIGISMTQFSDLSLLPTLVNLRIAIFRLCSFKDIPKEIFELHNLQSLDLSGNQISILPEPEAFTTLTNLRLLNLSENSINDIKEIKKLDTLIGLKHLVLSGNLCLSVNNAFNKIAEMFPKLIVLNDLIITSQHRGFIMGCASYDSMSTLPLSKTDDFFFLYVKYMHSSNDERYVRRANAEFFCLNRVIRKFSAAEKIQSVWRGFSKRTHYKKMKRSAVFIQDFTRYWYLKRMKAADKIQVAYLHFMLKKKIKRILCAKKIQSAWKRFLTRRRTLVTVFQTGNEITFYVKQDALEKIQQFLTERNFEQPKVVGTTPYKVIRYGVPKKSRLPGSPVVYYHIDSSILLRKYCNRTEINRNSIWCRHSHENVTYHKKVSKEGVNWATKCIFSSVKYIPYNSRDRTKWKYPQYPSLVKCTYKDGDVFYPIINAIVSAKIEGVILFPEVGIKNSQAHFTVQSAMRCFIERSKHFRSNKKDAIEHRAAHTIHYFLKSAFFRSAVNHSLKIIHYFNSIPNSSAFFVTQSFYESLLQEKARYPIHFGFTAERTVVLAPEAGGVLTQFIPQGKVVFALSDIPSIFRVGVTVTKALQSMLADHPPAKWLKRNHILRISFNTPEEARRRITLYSFMSDNTKGILNESDVIYLCAANSIKNAWIGWEHRDNLTHMAAQEGKKLNLSCLMRHNIAEKKPISLDSQQATFEKKILLEDRNPTNMIAELRQVYRPWHYGVEEYKNLNPYNSQDYERPLKQNKSKEPSQSMKMVGLVNDLENAFQNNSSITERSYSKAESVASKDTYRQYDSKPRSTSNTSASKASSVYQDETQARTKKRRPPSKPTMASIRYPHKPVKFSIPLETEITFAPPLTKLKNPRPTTSMNIIPKRGPLKKLDVIEEEPLFPINSTILDFKNSSYNIVVPEENDKKSEESSKPESEEISKLVPEGASLEKLVETPKRITIVKTQSQGLDDSLLSPVSFLSYQVKEKLNKRILPSASMPAIMKFDQFKPPKSIMTFSDADEKSFLEKSTPSPKEEKIEEKPKDPPFYMKEIHPPAGIRKPIANSEFKQNQESMQAAFTKLVRLHQIGILVQQASVFDESIEIKHMVAKKAKEEVDLARDEFMFTKQAIATETKQRNKIEEKEMNEIRGNLKMQNDTLRTKKTQKIRQLHTSHINRIRQETQFAQNFVNVSRKIAKQSEAKHMEASNRRKQEQINAEAMKVSQEIKNLHQSHRNKIEEIKLTKLRAAKLDQYLLSLKRENMRTSYDKRIQTVHDIRRQNKQKDIQKKLDTLKNTKYIPLQAPSFPLNWNPFEAAAEEIDQYLGANIGFTEAHMLCAIIDNILEN